MIFNSPSAPYPANLGLYEKQKEARDLAIADLRKQQFSILKIGQRGGKMFIASEIARCLEMSRVYIFDVHNETCAKDFPIANYFCGNEIPQSFFEKNIDVNRAMVIFNEPFWMDNSYVVFKKIRDAFPELLILVIGSNGPTFIDGWESLGGHSYATWEINPHCKEDELRKDLIKSPADEYTFDRDFGRF